MVVFVSFEVDLWKWKPCVCVKTRTFALIWVLSQRTRALLLPHHFHQFVYSHTRHSSPSIDKSSEFSDFPISSFTFDENSNVSKIFVYVKVNNKLWSGSKYVCRLSSKDIQKCCSCFISHREENRISSFRIKKSEFNYSEKSWSRFSSRIVGR